MGFELTASTLRRTVLSVLTRPSVEDLNVVSGGPCDESPTPSVNDRSNTSSAGQFSDPCAQRCRPRAHHATFELSCNPSERFLGSIWKIPIESGFPMDLTQLTVTEVSPAYWRISFNNPPTNLQDPDTILGRFSQCVIQTLRADIDSGPLRSQSWSLPRPQRFGCRAVGWLRVPPPRESAKPSSNTAWASGRCLRDTAPHQ